MRSLNNIEKSLKHQTRERQALINSFPKFCRHYHMPLNINSEKLWLPYNNSNKALPDENKFYKSYSTVSSYVPNMKRKTQIINLIKACHVLNNDFRINKIREIEECGKGITSARGRDNNTGFKHSHIIGGFFCNFRFCPIRQKTMTKKRLNKIYTISKNLYRRKDWVPIFITLTIPDCKPTPYHIRKSYKVLTKSWKKMSKYITYNGDNRFNKTHKGMLKGWIEKFEIPYNKRKNMYHPHIHVMGFVRKSYYQKQGSKYVIEKSQLKKDWLRACSNNLFKSEPIVSIEEPYFICHSKKIKISKCHSNDERNSCIKHATKEIAKYVSKGTDFAKIPTIKLNHRFRTTKLPKLSKEQINSANAFGALYHGLKGRKVIHYGGWCLAVSKLYNAYKKGDKKAFKILKPDLNLPDVTYKTATDSKFNFDYKDYLDKDRNLTKYEITKLKLQGLKVAPVDSITGKPLNKKELARTLKEKVIKFKLFIEKRYKCTCSYKEAYCWYTENEVNETSCG